MGTLILQRQPQVVALECSAIPDIEYTALKKLTEGEEKLREAGITLWLVGLNPAPSRTIQRAPLGATLGNERIFQDIGQAVEAYTQRFGREHRRTDMLDSCSEVSSTICFAGTPIGIRYQ